MGQVLGYLVCVRLVLARALYARLSGRSLIWDGDAATVMRPYRTRRDRARGLTFLTFHAACVAAAPSLVTKAGTTLSNLLASTLYRSRRSGSASWWNT